MKNNLEYFPLISVMIPCYNRADLLSEALQSVINQCFETKMEVWVVDDCSTKDNPEDIVNQYGKGIVKFYKQAYNVGQINNLNKCIELANGELIHILHCDDRVLPGFYAAIINAYIKFPDSGAFFTRVNLINHDGSYNHSSASLQQNSGYISNWFEKISTSQLILTPSMVVKKEVYDKVGGFKEKLSWTEDWEMWVRISKHFPVYYINEVLAEYRVANNSNSAVSFKTGRFIEDLKKAIEENYKHHQSLKVKKKSTEKNSDYILSVILKLYSNKQISKSTFFKLMFKYIKNKFSKKILFLFLKKKAKDLVKSVFNKIIKIKDTYRIYKILLFPIILIMKILKK